MHNDTFPTPDVWLEHRVSYGETDAMGFVYHAEYLHIFERSRGAYLRSLGIDYNAVEKGGLFFPVSEAWCRYRHPAKYDDLIVVHAGISELGRASLTFTYRLYDASRTLLLAEGTTRHACTNAEGRPTRLPEWLSQKLKPSGGCASLPQEPTSPLA